MKDLALDGVRVLDFTKWWAGPMAARILGEFGAEVIKIESTLYIDPWRGGTAPARRDAYPDGEPGDCPWNRAALFNTQNHNKLDVTLDLSQPAGLAVAKRLVALSDIVIENFSARVMPRLGLGYEVLASLKPDIIMVSMPGFGLTGPERDYTVFGATMEWLAGITQLTGYEGGPPQPMTGLAYGDPIGAFTGAAATLAALNRHQRTGKGLHIDISQIEALTLFPAEALMDYALNKRVQSRIGNRHPSLAPQGIYRCAGEDQWVAISVEDDEQWHSLCVCLGQPDLVADPRFATALDRLRHQEEADRLIENWTLTKTHREVMATLQKARVPAGAVLSARDLSEDPHLAARGFFKTISHPAAGTHRYPGNIATLTRTPGAIRRPAPCLGEHNDFVLREILGLSDYEVQDLVESGVVGTEPVM